MIIKEYNYSLLFIPDADTNLYGYNSGIMKEEKLTSKNLPTDEFTPQYVMERA